MATESQQMISPDVEAYQAMKILEVGDTHTAINKCHEAIAQFGPNRNLYLVKARAHLELEEYGFAEEALLSLLGLDPEHPAAWAMLGEVYFRLGKTAKVDYCRSRLENIFPALAEYLDQSADTDVKSSEETTEVAKSATQAGQDTIVPLEDVVEKSLSLANSISEGDSVLASELVPDPDRDENGPVGPTHADMESELKIFETATFAEICFDQGKYEKALEIYEKLLGQTPGNPNYLEKVKNIQLKIGTK